MCDGRGDKGWREEEKDTRFDSGIANGSINIKTQTPIVYPSREFQLVEEYTPPPNSTKYEHLIRFSLRKGSSIPWDVNFTVASQHTFNYPNSTIYLSDSNVFIKDYQIGDW